MIFSFTIWHHDQHALKGNDIAQWKHSVCKPEKCHRNNGVLWELEPESLSIWKCIQTVFRREQRFWGLIGYTVQIKICFSWFYFKCTTINLSYAIYKHAYKKSLLTPAPTKTNICIYRSMNTSIWEVSLLLYMSALKGVNVSNKTIVQCTPTIINAAAFWYAQ